MLNANILAICYYPSVVLVLACGEATKFVAEVAFADLIARKLMAEYLALRKLVSCSMENVRGDVDDELGADMIC